MRKILLLICMAFVVVCYGYPCFVLPIGSYTYEEKTDVLGAEVVVQHSYKFGFDGKVTRRDGDLSVEFNYKLKGNKIILSADEEFGNSDDVEMKITNMYTLNNYVNNIGLYSTIGIGALALLLVVTIPNKK